jgi:hypothetical protein
VLKPDGSLYLHCDPTASHYLKLVLDAVLGPANYRNEINWRRTSVDNDAKQGRQQDGNVRDVIFFYTSSDDWRWYQQYTPYDPDISKANIGMVSKEEATKRRMQRQPSQAATPHTIGA